MVSPGIKIRGASRRFVLGSGREVLALDRLDLDVPAGGFLVLMGPNGSGKTSLLRILDGSLVLDAGEVVLQAEYGRNGAAVVHVTQDPGMQSFDRLTLAEHFALSALRGARPRLFGLGVTRTKRRRFVEALERYGREDLVPFLDQPVEELSGGMRQAASILTSVLTLGNGSGEPGGVVLLDEPTASLDLENTRLCLELIERIHADGATVVLVTHDPSIAERVGGTLGLMSRGRLARVVERNEAGNIRELVAEFMAAELKRV